MRGVHMIALMDPNSTTHPDQLLPKCPCEATEKESALIRAIPPLRFGSTSTAFFAVVVEKSDRCSKLITSVKAKPISAVIITDNCVENESGFRETFRSRRSFGFDSCNFSSSATQRAAKKMER